MCTYLVHSLITSPLYAEVDHCVGQGPAHVELQGQVVDSLGISFVIMLLGSDPS